MTAAANSVRFSARAALLLLLLGSTSSTEAADSYPLRPPDTSSPRATLEGFITTTDEIYRRVNGVMEEYAASDRLYPTAEERREQLGALAEAPKAFRYLDLSGVPPVLRDTVSAERALQLKEILDRIELPPLVDIPDQDALTRQSVRRWRLPDTEIDIVRMEDGPRAGEYLFSADTIRRLPEFYGQVKELPYRPGPGEQLDNTFRKLSRSGTATVYEAFLSSPVGLSFIVPLRWILNLPDWAKVRIAGATAWQWLGLAVGSVTSGLIMSLAHRAAYHRTDHNEDALETHWRRLLAPVAILFVAGFLVPVLDTLLRIGGSVRMAIEYTRSGAVFLSVAWLVVVAFAVLGEMIVGSERISIRSLDNQLIRLGMRLVGVTMAAAIVIYGGNELGFPAYSVLAGLGVGGLAVALAAQSTIANLIGSLLIALEKPFRIGQQVRIGPTEGMVEDVGFRSTRIRTLDNTLVSIPSSAVVNTTVENLSFRTKRRQRFVVQTTYDTPTDKLERLVAGIKQILFDDPVVENGTYEVRFNNFAESSLDILVIFHLLVGDYASELAAREAVLLQIKDLVTKAGVNFAFPTRTLYVDNSAQGVVWSRADELAWQSGPN